MLHLPRTTFQFTPYDNAVAQLFWGLLPVERAAALFFYEPHSETAQLLYQLKYNQRPDIGEDMGRVMAQEMQLARYFDDIDVLLPVPLSPKRLRQRGYNQSEMLARGISDITRLPIDTRAVCRDHFHQSQTSLTRLERRGNVEDIFRLRHPKRLEGRHVLLIDDVCTTGATLMACGEAIRHVPGIRISVLTLAYTKR
jgi:ComF family protein